MLVTILDYLFQIFISTSIQQIIQLVKIRNTTTCVKINKTSTNIFFYSTFLCSYYITVMILIDIGYSYYKYLRQFTFHYIYEDIMDSNKFNHFCIIISLENRIVDSNALTPIIFLCLESLIKSHILFANSFSSSTR